MKVIAQDKGPGIADVERVLAGGYTTSNGLGMGVAGSKKVWTNLKSKRYLERAQLFARPSGSVELFISNTKEDDDQA